MSSEGSLLTVKGIMSSVQEAEIWSCYFLGTLLPWFKFFILLFSFAVTCYCWFILSEVIFFFEVFFEVIFNTSVFSGCVFALGSQRVSLCEGTER